MSKNWIMLAGLLLLGSVETSQGHPLDSSDIVYVDGQPCNRACQSYLAWSQRRSFSGAQRSSLETAPVASAPLDLAPEKPVVRSAPRASQRAAASHRQNSKPAVRRVARQATPSRPAAIAKPQSAVDATVKSEPAPSAIAAATPADSAAASPEPATTQQQAAATPPAEQVMSADPALVTQQESPTPKREESRAEPATPGDATATASAINSTEVSAATNDTGNWVAVLIARPEIEAVSDLAGKDVAIEDQQSALGASISAAIMAAGAADVRLSGENMKAIDRLIRGEVPAAVLTLVSAEAAAWFPEIPGYRIFRIPLSQDSVKARL